MSETTLKITAAEFKALTPTNTVPIVASHQKDQSDSMTDYFGSVTTKEVVIGFRTGSRDSFPQMRKAAATFEPTNHMGPGLDIYKVRVVFVQDCRTNGAAYWKGSYSPWHRELQQEFTTQGAVDAFLATAETPQSLTIDGVTVAFEWNVEKVSYEHREKWSMGHGYYLGYSKYSGWQVKATYPGWSRGETYEIGGAALALYRKLNGIAAPVVDAPVSVQAAEPFPGHAIPAAPVVETPAVMVRKNIDKGGVEVVFAQKPAATVIGQMKLMGFRWSSNLGLWYRKDTEGLVERVNETLGIEKEVVTS